MTHTLRLLFRLSALTLFVLCSLQIALANVTIKGYVEYYDCLRKAYFPAKNVLVEVEGDWLDTDVRVHTDDRGNYTATQRDPWIGNFDINIDVYAQTLGRASIYESMFSWWAYNVSSAMKYDINGGQTAVINLSIGGPRNTVAGTWYRSVAENANAFVLHQEVIEHYRKLEAMSFPASAFTDTDIIAPAMGMTAYYNYLTDFVNMTYSTLCAQDGFHTGMENWTNITEKKTGYYDNFYILDGMRHEVSHRVQYRLAGSVLIGLNIPANHSPLMESNQFLAYTEGFASFLPLATVNKPSIYEPTPSKYSNPAGIAELRTALPPVNNNAWEGEMTAMLVDLFDPASVKEQMRHPAQKSLDGIAMPDAIISSQTWTDRLSDSSLGRIRPLLAQRVVYGGISVAVQTANDFFEAYRRTYPQDTHALKAIAFNRCLQTGFLPQRTPFIEGSITIGRINANLIGLSFTVTELDPEDQKFVTVSLWRQQGTTVTQVGQTMDGSLSNWSSNKCSFNLERGVSNSTGADDKLWLLVSDEMLTAAYCIPTPAALPATETTTTTTTDDSSSGTGTGKRPWDRRFIAVPQPTLGGDRMLNTRLTTTLTAGQQQFISADQQQQAAQLRTAIRAARSELQSYATSMEIAERADRMLSGLARNAGGIQLGATAVTTDRAFQQWVGEVAAGRGLQRPLTAEAKTALATQATALNTALQLRQGAAGRAQHLNQQLATAVAAVKVDATSEQMLQQTKLMVADMQSALTKVSADQALSTKLTQQSAAMTTIAKR